MLYNHKAFIRLLACWILIFSISNSAFGAFSNTTVWESQAGASDANGGGFDPQSSNFATDLVTTNGTAANPVVTSATYNFAVRDQGHWLFIKSGTSWTPGWYQILTCSGNAATLTATAGSGVSFTTLMPTTAAGVGTADSLNTGTWSIDYSQNQTTIAYGDLVIGGTTTQLTSAAKPFGPNFVGNILNVTAGTGFTVQRLQVVSVSGVTATCDKSAGTGASTLGVATMGGPLLTMGTAGSLMLTGNDLYIKGAQTVTSASSNVAAGCLTLPAGQNAGNTTRCVGYNTIRGDCVANNLLARPTITASAIGTFILITMGTGDLVSTLNFDGANLTSSRGILGANGTRIWKCKVSNCTNAGIAGVSGCTAYFCECTGCSTNSGFNGGNTYGCYSHDNTTVGFTVATSCFAEKDISYNNTTAAGIGFSSSASTLVNYLNCTAYGNGGHGFVSTAAANTSVMYVNCVAVNNTGNGFNLNAAYETDYLDNCAGVGNSSGNVNTNFSGFSNVGFISLSVDPFNNAAGGDFSLTNVTGGGASLRAAGLPGSTAGTTWLGLSGTLNNLDVGAAQHIDSGTGSTSQTIPADQRGR